MKLTKEQIAIISSYYGTMYRYRVENIERLGTLSFNSRLPILRPSITSSGLDIDFKLILRPLWSITEKELRELAEVLGLKGAEVVVYKSRKCIQSKESIHNIVEVYENSALFIDIPSCKEWAKAINHLRQKGFCVDSQLVEWDLVEWKGVGK